MHLTLLKAGIGSKLLRKDKWLRVHLRQEQKWKGGGNLEESKWQGVQPLDSDGPPTSTSEPWVPPLENGFWGKSQQDHSCKVLNMVIRHIVYVSCSVIIDIILNWVLKKKPEFEKPRSGKKVF